MTGHPSVGVVVPTRARPQQLRAAVEAVLAQDYPGDVRVVVVNDAPESPTRLEPDGRLEVLANARSPGLPGARNTGVASLDTDLVAFCDDDDEWLPGKLRCQVSLLLARREAELASCGILVACNGRAQPRLVGRDFVTYDELVRSRMVMVHSSTYLVWREALVDRIGLFDESSPEGQNEDWDLALRAARRNPIAFVDQPLVRVAWGATSYFTHSWEAKVDGLLWILERHPDIGRSRAGAARAYGQLAFAYACLGRRAEARRWARRALRLNWHERRVPIALAVAAGLVSGERIVRSLNSRGHGI